MRQNSAVSEVSTTARDQRDRADRGADRGRDGERREHAADLLHPVHRGVRAEQAAQQERPDDDLGHGTLKY